MTFQRDLAWEQMDLVNRSSATYHFARYALTMEYSRIPEYVLHTAKRCILDALGCAIGAYDAPGRPMCEATIQELGGTPESTMFGSGLRTSAMNASLINSFLIRFLDYNDHIGGGGHGSDGLASILAVAEREKATGKDFLTSLVISYELGDRFRKSFSSQNVMEEKGWPNDIRAGMNMPPALGKLMGLNEDQIANAIGLCMSHSLPMGVLDSHKDEPTMGKNLRFGWVAHDAILSCMLAKKGFTGPVRIIESDIGIHKSIAQGHMDLERLIDFSGWKMPNVRFKALAANGSTHGHMFATLAIVKENDLKPEDIAEVRIRASVREAQHTTCPSKKYPKNAESADHSAFFTNAVLIKERAFGADAIMPEKFTDPVILDLIEKITVTGDPSMTHFQGASEIITKDGRRFTKRVDVPHGLANDELTDQELEEKFTDMASKYMATKQIKDIFDACWNLEKFDDLGKLTKLMVFPAK